MLRLQVCATISLACLLAFLFLFSLLSSPLPTPPLFFFPFPFPFPFLSFPFLFFVYFKSVSHYVAQAGIQQFYCFSHLSAGITGVYHHTQFDYKLLKFSWGGLERFLSR